MAMAMVFYFMWTAKHPLESDSDKSLINDRLRINNSIKEGERPVLKGNFMPKQLKVLVSKMWHQDPDCRPSMDDILTALETVDSPRSIGPTRPPNYAPTSTYVEKRFSLPKNTYDLQSRHLSMSEVSHNFMMRDSRNSSFSTDAKWNSANSFGRRSATVYNREPKTSDDEL